MYMNVGISPFPRDIKMLLNLQMKDSPRRRPWHGPCDREGKSIAPTGEKRNKGKTMNIQHACRIKEQESDGGHFLATWIRAHLAQITESLWFCLTFVLFVLLGPFSAIVALIGLGSLASEENRDRMVEPAKL